MILIWAATQFIKTSVQRRLLTLIFTVSLPLAHQESVAQIQIRGEVGGNVTFRCPVDRHKTITFFYFQRGDEFINGFHTLKRITQEKWENTRVENSKATVQMTRLKVSHSGDYQCVIQYKERSSTSVTDIHLNVTANYSKPALTISCQANRCQLTCTANGGYPQTKLKWNVLGNSSGLKVKILNVSEESDPNTMLYNTSSTVSFNCSYGEESFISCSVGGTTSELLSICVPNYHNAIVTATICSVVLLFIAIILAVLIWKCKQQKKNSSHMNKAVDPKEIRPLK
ncbi:T-lymphocyte activation antigen CD80-like [Festucalex cinctus]